MSAPTPSGTYQGRKNIYTCQKCRAVLVTVDRDHGVTPFIVHCGSHNPAGCGGEMHSSFYRVNPAVVPTCEWYSPDEAERRALQRSAPHAYEHVVQGGLLLRPIAEDSAPAAPTAPPTLRRFDGQIGSAHELTVDLAPREGKPEQSATLAHWFVSLPPAHPLWSQYLLFTCHLRDVPGQSRPPVRPPDRPDATHNLMLVAFNPETGPWTAESVVEKMIAPARTGSAFLMPVNVSEFFVATDAQAVELTALTAHALVDGFLWAECDDVRGARDRWREAIRQTLQHLALGSHPEDN